MESMFATPESPRLELPLNAAAELPPPPPPLPAEGINPPAVAAAAAAAATASASHGVHEPVQPVMPHARSRQPADPRGRLHEASHPLANHNSMLVMGQVHGVEQPPTDPRQRALLAQQLQVQQHQQQQNSVDAMTSHGHNLHQLQPPAAAAVADPRVCVGLSPSPHCHTPQQLQPPVASAASDPRLRGLPPSPAILPSSSSHILQQLQLPRASAAADPRLGPKVHSPSPAAQATGSPSIPAQQTHPIRHAVEQRSRSESPSMTPGRGLRSDNRQDPRDPRRLHDHRPGVEQARPGSTSKSPSPSRGVGRGAAKRSRWGRRASPSGVPGLKRRRRGASRSRTRSRSRSRSDPRHDARDQRQKSDEAPDLPEKQPLAIDGQLDRPRDRAHRALTSEHDKGRKGPSGRPRDEVRRKKAHPLPGRASEVSDLDAPLEASPGRASKHASMRTTLGLAGSSRGLERKRPRVEPTQHEAAPGNASTEGLQARQAGQEASQAKSASKGVKKSKLKGQGDSQAPQPKSSKKQQKQAAMESASAQREGAFERDAPGSEAQQAGSEERHASKHARTEEPAEPAGRSREPSQVPDPDDRAKKNQGSARRKSLDSREPSQTPDAPFSKGKGEGARRKSRDSREPSHTADAARPRKTHEESRRKSRDSREPSPYAAQPRSTHERPRRRSHDSREPSQTPAADVDAGQDKGCAHRPADDRRRSKTFDRDASGRNPSHTAWDSPRGGSALAAEPAVRAHGTSLGESGFEQRQPGAPAVATAETGAGASLEAPTDKFSFGISARPLATQVLCERC